jgi:isochorismate pyruvate lyase
MMIPADACDSIDDIREAIDEIDRSLVAALGRRAAYVTAAARFKTTREAVRAEDRVQVMLQARRAWAADAGLHPDFVEKLFRLVVEYFIGRELADWEKPTR